MTTHTANNGHQTHRPLYLKIFAVLMVLLAVTVGAAKVPLPGSSNLIVALTIAVIKGALIVMYFMHFKDSDHLTWLIGSATLVWFGIMIALTYNDYWSRDWTHMLGK
jgi:cytochrome c oxidase subunit 4